MKIILLAVIGYLIGSIPSGYIFTNKLLNKDLRNFGSGNVGATNTARVLGIKLGFLVAVLDGLKGFIAVWIAQLIFASNISIFAIFLVGLTAIIGHNWSIFLNFSGGKGVATTLGVILKIFPMSFLIFVIVWFLITILTRYVSLASLMGAVSMPFSAFFLRSNSAYFYYMSLLAVIIIFTHHENINRLIKGNESRMSWPPDKKKGDNNE